MSSSRPPAYIIAPLAALVAVVAVTSTLVLNERGSDALVGEPASSRG